MVAYNFKKNLVKPILSNEKFYTIRATRRSKEDDKLQLYTGQRTKQCKLIGYATCSGTYVVFINEKSVSVENHRYSGVIELDTFARGDGFKCFEDMKDFFRKTHGLPFQGFITYWRDFAPAEGWL